MRLCLLIILLASSANADRLGYCTLSNSSFCSAINANSATSEPSPFEDGTFNNTELNGDGNLVLTAAQTSGDFTSAVIDAGSATTWNGIEWATTLPFYKELPSNGVDESTTDYEDLASSTLLNNQEVLWHFNNTVAPILDNSGNSRTTTSVGAPTYGEAGRFINSLKGDGIDAQYSSGWTSAISGANARTWSFWYKATGANGFDFFGGHGQNSGSNGLLGVFLQDIGGGESRLRVTTGSEEPIELTGSSLYVNGAWHHVTLTYDGTDLLLYFNGAEVANVPIALNTSNATGEFDLLAYPSNLGAYRLDYGNIDESSVWSRALTATEVLQLYRRGANRVKFQVRSCNDAACSGETWLGPDGTSATYFTELNNNSNQEDMDGSVLSTPPSMVFSNFGSLSVASNRYFQYKIFLETDNATYTPEVTNVSVN